jgi:predicted nucleotidyltransferase component of viral defense system/DNA-directed RNA polymerase subunit RPC12/RpoP
MISRDEIDERAANLDVNPSDLQRDYLFGWLLAGLYEEGTVAKQMALKGGNCLRKAYFKDARFSRDLDFGVPQSISPDALRSDLLRACAMVSARAGVQFDDSRLLVKEKSRVDDDLSVWDARVYFRDFYGKNSSMTISVRMDVTEFDRAVLSPITLPLLHGYSDAADCTASLRVMRLEEVLGTKLKCLLQRKHVADLYDVVHWLFFGDHTVDRQQVIQVFLAKTIYRTNPGAAGELLRGLAFDALTEAWARYIVCASQVRIAFQDGVSRFIEAMGELFPAFGGLGRPAFFESRFRNVILEAGRTQTLLRATYGGKERLLEPYSLRYKRTVDGKASEYFYAYDIGGRSTPGLKSLLPGNLSSVENTEQAFEPRFTVELSKAGEPAEKGHFRRPSSGLPRVLRPGRASRKSTVRKPVHLYRCSICGKTFRRQRRNAERRDHVGSTGMRCNGRLIYQGMTL